MWIVIVVLLLLFLLRPRNNVILFNPRAAHRMTIPGTTRLLCYNIFMWPGFYAYYDQNKRLEQFLKLVKHYDVLVLQEMFSFLTWRQRKLLRETYPYAATGYSRFIDSGIITISKYPILATDSHVFTTGTYWEGLTPRQVIWTMLPHIHIFNTHLQATHAGMTHRRHSEWVRTKQMDELIEFVRGKIAVNPDLPALVCGDLNMEAGKMEYIRTMDRFGTIVDLFPQHEPTFPEDQSCIDYLLWIDTMSGNTTHGTTIPRGTVEPMENLSDHWALSINWEYNK